MRDVLRISAGDMIDVALPDGEKVSMTAARIDGGAKKIVLQKCNLKSAGPNEGAVFAASSAAQNGGAGIEYTLLQFIPKPAKMELIVRQATECGISRIIPVIGEYTQGGTEKSLQKNSARYEKIIREARQQSGSPVDTKILMPVKLDEALKKVAAFSPAGKSAAPETEADLGLGSADAVQKNDARVVFETRIVLYERNESTVTLKEALAPPAGKSGSTNTPGSTEPPAGCRKGMPRRVFIAVGSEGGISPDEFNTLLDAGFSGVHFNTNILRCETAALYGIAAVQAALGE